MTQSRSECIVHEWMVWLQGWKILMYEYCICIAKDGNLEGETLNMYTEFAFNSENWLLTARP